MATAADAALKIVVDGNTVGNEFTLVKGDTAAISIYSDGQTLAYYDVYMSIAGPGLLDLSNGHDYVQGEYYGGDGLGWVNDDPTSGIMFMDFAKLPSGEEPAWPPIMTGTALDGVVFTCTDLGDVTLTLFGYGGIYPANDYVGFDTVVIHQVPEPITLGLLGLGGLFLRRRK